MAVGKEKLRTMVRDMCADAGIVEKKTNHSLRVSGNSHIFACSVPVPEFYLTTTSVLFIRGPPMSNTRQSPIF